MTTYDPTQLPEAERELLLAGAGVVARSGGNLEFGADRDDVHYTDAKWWAKATYPGGQHIDIDPEHPGPGHAVDALGRKLLRGAMCNECNAVVSFDPYKAWVPLGALRTDGSTWTREAADAAGICVWRRVADSYQRGCGQLSGAAAEALLREIDTVPADKVTSRQNLAAAAIAADAPAHIVFRALYGYYADYDSELPFPTRQLVDDLRAAGLDDMADRAVAGDFDATPYETAQFDVTGAVAEITAALDDPETAETIVGMFTDARMRDIVTAEVDRPAETRAPRGAAWSTPRPGARPNRPKRRRNR